jgi:hypothetical protein
VEGDRTVARDLPEQVRLRLDVGVQGSLLDPHGLREIADRRTVVALLGEEASGLARELVSACAHVGTLTIVRV